MGLFAHTLEYTSFNPTQKQVQQNTKNRTSKHTGSIYKEIHIFSISSYKRLKEFNCCSVYKASHNNYYDQFDVN